MAAPSAATSSARTQVAARSFFRTTGMPGSGTATVPGAPPTRRAGGGPLPAGSRAMTLSISASSLSQVRGWSLMGSPG